MRPSRLSRAAVTLPIVWLAECALESLPESGARDRERPLWPSAAFGSGRSASLTCEEPEAAATGRRIAATNAATSAPLLTMLRTLATEPGRVDPVRGGLRHARDVGAVDRAFAAHEDELGEVARGEEQLALTEGRAGGNASLRAVAESAQVERRRAGQRERGSVLEVREEARLVRGRKPLDLLVERVELTRREHEDAVVRDRRRVDEVALAHGRLADEVGLAEREHRQIRAARRSPRPLRPQLHGPRVQAPLAREPEPRVELRGELLRQRRGGRRGAGRDDDVQD